MTEDAIGDLLRASKAVAVLRLTDDYTDNYQAMRPARIELWFDSATENGPRGATSKRCCKPTARNIASARLLAHGVSPATLAPIELQRYDTGTNASRSAVHHRRHLGILFLPAFFCSLSAAVDSTAGERERRSLEVLMAQPARSLGTGGRQMAGRERAVAAGRDAGPVRGARDPVAGCRSRKSACRGA